MFLGQFSPSLFFKVCSYVITISIFIIYYTSQWFGHEKPWPNCWISACANHYPEFVFFRIGTISGSALMILGWLTNHFYLKSISREAVFKIQKYHPEISLILGMMGGMLLMGSTANIDTGIVNSKWHTFCASRFFIFTLAAQVYNSVIYWIVHCKIGKVNTLNLYFKLFLSFLLLVQLIISIKYGVYEIEIDETGVDSVIGKILQWTLTVTVISGFYSMGADTQKFQFVYEMATQQQQRFIQEID